MQINKTRYILSLIGSFLLGAVLIGGFCAVKMNSPEYASLDNNKIKEIQEQIDAVYLNDYNIEDLIEGACKGYVSGLGDQYTVYMGAKEYQSWLATTTGDYSGVGITFALDGDARCVIQQVNEGSPAEKAGIKPGDYIIKVNDKTYDEYQDVDVLASDIRGKEGTKVTLTISRDGEEKDVTMTRSHITLNSVSYEMMGNIGYIEIDSFMENTASDFKKALNAVQKQGAKSLILDLRDNGGGLVDQCVDIADEFLDEGVICYTEDKDGNRDSYDAEDGKTDLKTVVLINENSASASEILAAAMKDNGFELVGETSFGKGVIQGTIEFDDGSALKITVMQYLSPKENVIHHKGIEPTYKVENDSDSETDAQLEKAKELLR